MTTLTSHQLLGYIFDFLDLDLKGTSYCEHQFFVKPNILSVARCYDYVLYQIFCVITFHIFNFRVVNFQKIPNKLSKPDSFSKTNYHFQIFLGILYGYLHYLQDLHDEIMCHVENFHVNALSGRARIVNIKSP